MEIYWSDITFLQYRKYFQKLIHSDTEGDSDYYGGNTTTAYNWIDIKELYDLLLEHDKLEL